jgi:hypothetical protein
LKKKDRRRKSVESKSKSKSKSESKSESKSKRKSKSKIIVAQDFGLSSSFGCGINQQPTTIKLKDERKNAGQAKGMNNGLANM